MRNPLVMFVVGMGVVLVALRIALMPGEQPESASYTTEAKVAILDFHRGDASYEFKVMEVLLRLNEKFNANPELIAGKAVCVQELLQRLGQTESLLSILEGVNASIPGNKSIVGMDEAFAAYYTLRSR